MSDNRPQPADRKRHWIAPLIVVGLVVAMLGTAQLIGLSRRSPPQPQPAPAPSPLPELPKPILPLTRADLVEAADGVADDYAAGAPLAAGIDPLVGRQFKVVTPFGCNGPQADPGVLQASYQYDPGHKALRITARPGTWTMLPLIQQLPGAADIEDVEGFWVSRPWTTLSACPPIGDRTPPATPTPAAPQTLGLAEIFAKGGSRVLRRDGRPYEFIRKVADGDTDLVAHAYGLVLEGRLIGYPDGRALHCWSESIDHRPICLYAVEFDRVAFEDAVTHDVVADWKQ
jgi:hypothetical protein